MITKSWFLQKQKNSKHLWKLLKNLLYLSVLGKKRAGQSTLYNFINYLLYFAISLATFRVSRIIQMINVMNYKKMNFHLKNIPSKKIFY